MDVMVVAGEASGDQHAAGLVRALQALRPELRFFGMGGEKLKAAGVELIHGAHEISVMGIVEVLPKLPRLFKVLDDLIAAARERKPVAAILVDVPDFNFRVAQKLKPLGVKIAWYISPMVWAWREGRTETLKKLVDRLLCILPFEEPFLRERGVDAVYVGNPVLEQVPPAAPAHTYRQALGLPPDAPVLAVLPGSRKSELRRLGATLAQTAALQAQKHAGLKIVVPVAPGLSRDEVLAPFSGLDVVALDSRAPEAVGASDVALVASGTATLEAALMRRPLVAVYRVAPLSYLVGKLLVKIPFFCLPNLLAKKRVVPELLQGDCNPAAIDAALEPLWSGPAREECLAGLDEVRRALGEAGASQRAAAEVAKLLPGS